MVLTTKYCLEVILKKIEILKSDSKNGNLRGAPDFPCIIGDSPKLRPPLSAP